MDSGFSRFSFSRISTARRPHDLEDGTPLLSQPGQPARGAFTNAHDFSMHNTQLVDVQGDFHQHSGKTGNETFLSHFIYQCPDFDMC